MSLLDVVPEELQNANELEFFLQWLEFYPVPVHTKKYILLDWVQSNDVEMKREYADRVGIPDQI